MCAHPPRTLGLVLLCTLALVTECCKTRDGGSKVLRDRSYTVDVPARSVGKETAAPVLVLIHGLAGDAGGQESAFHLRRVAFAHGALFVLIDGVRNKDGYRFWNAGAACCDLYGQGPDDLGYLDAVLDDLAARHRVDGKRIFLVGNSNGGFLAHRYACERARRVAGIVSVAGAGPAEPCSPSEPVAVLQIHGDADDVIFLEGGNLGDPRALQTLRNLGLELPAGITLASYPPLRRTLGEWAARDGCAATPDLSVPPIDLDTAIPGPETAVARWTGCAGGAVELWTIHGGGHQPSFAAGWGEKIWAFLAAHAKP